MTLELTPETLQGMLDHEDTRWFAERRLALLAGSQWSPDLHPRGPDGKFIEKWGFVRWLVDGMWERGRVENILPDGEIIVAPDNDRSNLVTLKTNRAYSLPTPKGHLDNNPDPNTPEVPDNWKKTGEQGGSNPGAFYTVQETLAVRPDPTAEQIDEVTQKIGGFDAGYAYKEVEEALQGAQPESMIGLYTNYYDKKTLVFNGDGVEAWNEAKISEDLQVWVTTSPLDAEEARLTLIHGMDIEADTQFYVKRTKSAGHGYNEMLANELYKMAGVPVPDLFFGKHQTVASKILVSSDPDSPVQKLSEVKDDPEVLKQIRQNMAVDAWLANWDVAGLTYDNIMVVDGIPYRIDTGGSLQYRAQGGSKDAYFGPAVGELATLRDPSLNPSSSHVFKDITQAELRDGGERVAAISPKQIKEMTASVGVSPSVADTLIARRAYLISTLSLVDPHTVYVPPKLYSIAKQSQGDEMFWNPLDDMWQPGILKKQSTVLWDEINVEILSLFDSGDPDVHPTVGDTVAVNLPGEFVGLFRVTEVDGSAVTGVSALNPENKETYPFHVLNARVVEKSDKLDLLYTQYSVASVNALLIGHTLDQNFSMAIINEDQQKPPVTLRPWVSRVSGDDLWNLKKGDFVYRTYDDDEGEHREVFRINGVTENLVSMTNVIDGKERQLTWDDWVENYTTTEWHIPDEFTQDLTLAQLRRDQLLTSEDQLAVLTLEMDTEIVGTDPDVSESTAFNTTPVTVDLETLGATESLTNEFGINNTISVGESKTALELWDEFLESLPVALADLEAGPVLEPTSLQEFLGQTIIISTPNPKEMLSYNYDRRGLWHVEAVEVEVWKNYSGVAQPKATLKLRSPGGTQSNIVIAGTEQAGQLITPVVVIDASIPQTEPQMKANGDIVLEGVIVGTHGKTWSNFEASIFPEFSVNGTAKHLRSDKKMNLRKMVGIYTIPQLQPQLVKKSEQTKASKAAMLAAAVDTKTRADFPTGTWVQAPDGFTGQVLEVPDLSLFNRFPSAVKVADNSGKVRVINANLLYEAGGHASALTVPEPIPHSLAEVKTETGSAPFYPLKYGDGNDPRIGQKVKAGKGDKEIEGVIVWVTPPGGKQASKKPYADVIGTDGKKVKKSLSIITLLEDVAGAPVPVDSPVAVSVKPDVEKIIDYTPQEIADVGMKYIMPDGETLAQAQWERDAWLKGSPKRKLTKDGYAPRVGMRVRSNEGTPLMIVGLDDVFKRPNYVRVVNMLTGQEEKGQRASSALWVDHPAEIGDSDHPLDYVRGITMVSNDSSKASIVDGSAIPGIDTELLPNGTVIYKAASSGQVYIGGQYRHVDRYFFITESGQIQFLTYQGGGGSIMSPLQSRNFLASTAQLGNLHKVAIIDDGAPDYGAFTEASGSSPSAFISYNPGAVSHEEALSGHFLEMTGVQVKGVENAVPIPVGNLNNLPKPADAVDLAENDLIPDPPVVTGVVGALDQRPKTIPIKSVMTAGLEIWAQREDTGAGSGTEYAFGDAEFIEDMQVRSQIAKEQNSGKVYVEFHFRMLEGKAEATADKLLTAGKNTEYGKWEARPENVRASELVVGDTISVRTSSMSEALKPANGESPNARVVAEPVLLGNDSKGTPIYRVTIAAADGTTGAIDIQERSLPSVRVYDWNPAAIASVSSSTSVKLTSKAYQAGWSEMGTVSFDTDLSAGVVSLDVTGAKLFKGIETQEGASTGGGAALGRRLHRGFDDGSYVRFNAVPSSVSGTSSGGGGGTRGEIRRWNETGMVTIRIPGEVANDPEAFQASVSRAMEAVGIPSEKQAPASPEHIALFGLNKVFKAHASDFGHRESPVALVSPNDPAVAKVLGRMTTELASTLGRPVTLSDIEFHVFEDGRLQVMVSKEVARAISKRQGNLYYRHTGHYDENKIAEIIAGPNRGLMGGSERFSLGIFTQGQSTRTDMSKGSGNRIYMTGKQMNNRHDQGAFIFSADAINRSTEVYVNPSDAYGNRSIENRFLTLGGGYEYMVKNKVEASQLAYFVAVSDLQRMAILALLKEKGVTHVGGRPVEDVIVLEVPFEMTSDEFQNIGSVFDTIKLATIAPVDEAADSVAEAAAGVGAAI